MAKLSTWTRFGILTVAVLATHADATDAQALLASVFSDHAVLQRDQPIRVWGQAAPNADVVVDLAEQHVAVVADSQGRWTATLPARQPGAPLTLKVRAGGRSRTVNDLLVGDVWLCSGQSNMEFQLVQALNGVVEAMAVKDSEIRLLQTGHISVVDPASDLPRDVVWHVATPADAARFSAACYFMGRDLKQKAGVPIGLIDASWGGSAIHFWISRDALAPLKLYDEALLRETDYSQSAVNDRWREALERWAYGVDPQGRVWREPDFDDSGWASMPAEDFWEKTTPALQSFDGTIWLRSEIVLTAGQAAQGGELLLGTIDDIDSTYVNGQAVGSTEGWTTPRNYRVDKGVLKEGRNVIAIRLIDSGGLGGTWSRAAEKGLRIDGNGFVPLGTSWRYQVASQLSATGQPPHLPWPGTNGPASMYNGMIAPLTPYGIKGVAWYQGESNVLQASEYARLLPAMIADWRRAFRKPDLPFLLVQLANYGAYRATPAESGWAKVRDVQRRTAAADAHVGLASAQDIGDIFEIHPANKQQVGARLALVARKLAYGETDLNASGPAPLSARKDGSAVVVVFDQPLTVFGAARPAGFELCDAAACRFVDADMQGSSIRIMAGASAATIKVRFAWSESPIVNLYGANNLPATPFEMPVE